MELTRLVEVVSKVRATTKKTEKVALVAGFFRHSQGRERELAALYLSGALPQGRIGVGWRMIQDAMVEGPPSSEPLTLIGMDQIFGAIAADQGLRGALLNRSGGHDVLR